MRLMFVGDINLGEYYTSFGHGPLNYLRTGNVFSNVQNIFDQADIVIGNLEAPLTTNNLDPNDPQSAVLRGNPESAKLLFESGFKVLQIANNHTVQHGDKGFTQTIESLKLAGISPIGLEDQEVLIIHLNGEKIGFLAASDVPDNTNTFQTCYQRLNDEFLKRVKVSTRKVDHLFLMLHWGLESSTTPLPYQLELIEKFKEFGVRGVIGAHPHLFYEIWNDNRTIIAPSLGNFVFDLAWDKRLLKSGILDIEINKTNIQTQVWPVFLRENGCLPTPTKEPILLSKKNKIKLYNLGKDMNGGQIRKLLYFLKNITKGNLKLKIKFILQKFSSLLK